jgi:hypothetical protein
MRSILNILDDINLEIRKFLSNEVAPQPKFIELFNLQRELDFSLAGNSDEFLNYYVCPECGNRWYDVYGESVDMDCLRCNLSDIVPINSNRLLKKLKL